MTGSAGPSRTRRPRRGVARLAVSVSGATRGPSTGAAAGLAAWLVRAAPRSARGSVDVALVSDDRMRDLHLRYRGTRHATDVLSFPAGRSADPNPQSDRQLGDIAIALGVARRQAAGHAHSLAMELRILALHGLLHLLGYDHERDDGEMRALEDRLRRRLGLSAGVVARASGSRTSR
jgi:probable rRNA maturation factor